MCALIRFITDTGVAPDIDLPLDFVPADICAAAIRHISAQAEASGRTYYPGLPEVCTPATWLTGCAVADSRFRPYLIANGSMNC